MRLLLALALEHNCRITKGVRKSRLVNGDPTFDARIHESVARALGNHLGIGQNDPRLVVTEVRRTRRSIYHSAYHPDWGSMEIRQSL